MSNKIKKFGKGKPCVVRTSTAGVFFGVLGDRDGDSVIIESARRIWSWEGAFTLSAVAVEGISGGKLSRPVEKMFVIGVIEIIPASKIAAAQLKSFPCHEPV